MHGNLMTTDPAAYFEKEQKRCFPSGCKSPSVLLTMYFRFARLPWNAGRFGFHPKIKPLGLLNGMGTKGCSLAPYFAAQLVSHMTQQTPLAPEADITRFRNLLSKLR